MSTNEALYEGRKLHDAWFDGPDMEPRDRMLRMAKVAREIHQPRVICYVVVDRDGGFIKSFEGEDRAAAQAFADEWTAQIPKGIDWDYRVAAITELAS